MPASPMSGALNSKTTVAWNFMTALLPRLPAFELRPTRRRRCAGRVDQVLYRAHSGNPACRIGYSHDVVLVLQDTAEEDHAILDIHTDMPLRDARAAVQLALDLVRERQVIQRLRLPSTRVDRATGHPDRMRLGAPGTYCGTALAAAQLRERTVARDVATATAGARVEEVLQ